MSSQRATAGVVSPARPETSQRRPLRLVPPLRSSAPRAPFVVLIGALLTSGLAGLLLLHTALAEDSFRLHDLKNRSALLTDRQQALEQLVAFEASPRRLAARAEAMGMVRAENPAFIRLRDGKVLGKPKAGVAPPPVATSQSTASTSPSATPSSSPTGSPSPNASSAPTTGATAEKKPR